MEPDTQNAEPQQPTSDSQLPRGFLKGIELFNQGEYFEAHEVWEELWMECPAAERRFIQALIQAAVAVYHLSRGNLTGATRLFHSGRRYMEPYRPTYLRLDVAHFWQQMEAHLAPALTGGATGPRPVIVLVPPPAGPT
ncbi:MAG: DUF309 domain-containing protein [Planctomycetaceae bacterium]|nr:DUF309 domain-containing protein [Planctomycetaceae bacterium]